MNAPLDRVKISKQIQLHETARQHNVASSYHRWLADCAIGADIAPERGVRAISSRGTLERLYESDRIQRADMEAARDIERCHRAIAGVLFAKCQTYGEVRAGSGEEWSAYLADVVKHRYLPWTKALHQKRGGRLMFRVVIGVVIDGAIARNIDKAQGWRKGKAVDWLIEGLELYTVIAGWRVKK